MRGKPTKQNTFERFSRALIGLPVSHVWRGYGSALFLEFGQLKKSQVIRRDGTRGDPFGQTSLMIQWSWRIEGPRSILCGSWSEEEKWPSAFAKLLKAKVVGLSLLGRLNEIDVELSNGLHVVSFSTTDGQPQWALIDHVAGESLHIRGGRPCVEIEQAKSKHGPLKAKRKP